MATRHFISFVILASLVSGCATCRRHPLICGIAAAVAVGAVAESVQRHHDQPAVSHRMQSQPTPCEEDPALCQ